MIGVNEKESYSMNNPYSKPSAEEQELWWQEGMKGKNFRRLYDARIAKREAWNSRNGVTTTYKSEESTLPEIEITAPRETEEQKQTRLKQDYENLAKVAITAAGFVPGLDTVADIVDFRNSWRKGDYSGMLWTGLGLGLPISGKALKTGWNAIKNFPNYYKTIKVAKTLDRAISYRIKAEKYLLKRAKEQGLDPMRYVIFGKPVGLPEKDPEAFYHYGRLPIKDGKLIPKPGFNGQEGRIWWDLGNVPKGDYIVVTKSKLVDENVLEHPEKYSPYHGHYLPSYYTSGAIPIDEVEIYTKNPFTRDYEGGSNPHHKVARVVKEKLKGKTYYWNPIKPGDLSQRGDFRIFNPNKFEVRTSEPFQQYRILI